MWGFPHLFSIVPTNPRRCTLRWSCRTLTRLPIRASSESMRVSPLGSCATVDYGPSPFPFPQQKPASKRWPPYSWWHEGSV
jgi:hypothetical protein